MNTEKPTTNHIARAEAQAIFNKHNGTQVSIVQVPMANYVLVIINEASWVDEEDPATLETISTVKVGKNITKFVTIGTTFK